MGKKQTRLFCPRCRKQECGFLAHKQSRRTVCISGQIGSGEKTVIFFYQYFELNTKSQENYSWDFFWLKIEYLLATISLIILMVCGFLFVNLKGLNKLKLIQ